MLYIFKTHVFSCLRILLMDSVTRWQHYLSQHLAIYNYKKLPKSIFFYKLVYKLWLILLNESSQMVKAVSHLAKVAIFFQIWSHCSWTVNLKPNKLSNLITLLASYNEYKFVLCFLIKVPSFLFNFQWRLTHSFSSSVSLPSHGTKPVA